MIRTLHIWICILLLSTTVSANEVITKAFPFPENISITKFNALSAPFVVKKDKKYLVSFWASWCVPCITEIKHFARIESDLKQNDITLVLINVDRRPKTAIPKFLKKHGIAYNTFYVADMYEAMEAFDATGLPITVAVKNAQVLFRYDFSRIRWDETLSQTIIEGFHTEN